MNNDLSEIIKNIKIKIDLELFDEALKICNSALLIFPNSFEIYQKRSEVFYSKGSYDSAFNDLDQVIKLAPEEAAPFFRRGRWKLKVGDCEGSIKDFSIAIDLDSGYFGESAFYFRALAYYNCQDYEKALLDCEKVREDFALAPSMMTRSKRLIKKGYI